MNKLGQWLCKIGVHNHTIYKIEQLSLYKSYDYAICKRCGKKFHRRNDNYTLSCWIDEDLAKAIERGKE